MAHLLTIHDIKQERKRLENAIAIMPLSVHFSDDEKKELLEIFKTLLHKYDTALARSIEVNCTSL